MSEPNFELFGLTVASDFPFRTPLLRAALQTPDIVFLRADDPAAEGEWDAAPLIYASRQRNAHGENWLQVYRAGTGERMHFARLADFYLLPGRILYRPLADDNAAIEANFLSSVMAYWLERSGVLALHASAAATERGVIGLLARSGHGKSGIAGALLMAGHALVSDDILALEAAPGAWLARAGFPAMRLWPDIAARLAGDPACLDRVHPAGEKRLLRVGAGGLGRFAAGATPLRALFLLERRPPGETDLAVTITPLRPQEALIALVGHSFAARLLQQNARQPQRLQTLARLASDVPLYRLVYPSGFEHWPRITAALEGI